MAVSSPSLVLCIFKLDKPVAGYNSVKLLLNDQRVCRLVKITKELKRLYAKLRLIEHIFRPKPYNFSDLANHPSSLTSNLLAYWANDKLEASLDVYLFVSFFIWLLLIYLQCAGWRKARL